jgi:hypothetical protein
LSKFLSIMVSALNPKMFSNVRSRTKKKLQGY